MRVIFTIVLNGLHHLKHNNYSEMIPDICDLWVIAEGAVKNGGSTSWCRSIPPLYHNNGASVDGTIEYLKDLTNRKKNVFIVQKQGLWESKDEQVNTALSKILDLIGTNRNRIFLWEVDCDEQWNPYDMKAAEEALLKNRAKTGCFLAEFYVGEDIVAKGDWGEGKKLPYRRLWDWKGELFISHEPPILSGGNNPELLLPQRFRHYAYYFEQDVKFKEVFYTGHENIHSRWLELQKEKNFPQPISRLISGNWGKTNTIIERVLK